MRTKPFQRFFAHKLAPISLAVILFFCFLALASANIANLLSLNPNTQDILHRYGAISTLHWAGTDELGRDFFIRLIFGARVSLAVAIISAITATFLGLIIGMLAGYFGGWLDTILMRITDSLLALPLLPILILLAAIDFGKLPVIGWLLSGHDSSMAKMILIFVFFSWMTEARLVRSLVLSYREQDFVQAARAIGQSNLKIIFREILPNVLSPVIVSVSLAVGKNILFEASLSFLGLGIQPPTPSWGNMLNNAMEAIYASPSQVVIPGFLIFLVVISFNFLGDGLQEALNPKSILPQK